MKGLLKFITCGSVDDGKSTLIGHILYDAKLLYADQEKALELDSKVGSRGGAIDYSLLLDGLLAEREQGITIDVAYRYFTTDSRSFIVADTPGHEEYTRNMAVGASFADLAVILVDASQGVLIQTRRHTRICSLMGISHFVFAVNKMDLMGYSEKRFQEIKAEIEELSKELSLSNVVSIPLSATEGDNVTEKSANMPWYGGTSLLDYLENVDVINQSEEGFVLPVQRVCRPNHRFRGFQGQIESGMISIGDEITALPGKETALVKKILAAGKESKTAAKGQAVTVSLDREVDVSRGCVLVKDTALKAVRRFDASLLWMDDTDLTEGKEFIVKSGTKVLPGMVTKIQYKINVNTGEHEEADVLKKNEIARCEIFLSQPAVVDTFSSHKTLGELILIDRISNMTSACGVVEEIKAHKDSEDEKYAFVSGDIKAGGDVFEEYYYNLETLSIYKSGPVKNTYMVGDRIPLKGESFSYPASMDILILRDWAAVQVRSGVICSVESLNNYCYAGFPVVNGRGFSIHLHSQEGFERFVKEYEEVDGNHKAEFLNRWMDFGTYRKIIFNNNFWII